MIKVAVCCIGRQENRYINEFISHYLNLGVDKIFIYDNNGYDEEYFESAIDTTLITSKIDIIDYRGKDYCQLKCYQECYDTYKEKFDWFLFIDCDEFLYINEFNNIKDFLTQTKFNNFDMIHINWMTYGDSNNIFYENKPLNERFTTPILPIDFKVDYEFAHNNHIKSIVRGGMDELVWGCTPHTPSNNLKCCGADGNVCDSTSPFLQFDFTYAHFKHYTTKTIEEFLTIKVNRGFPDGNKDLFKIINPIENFFKFNSITEEKIEYIKEYYKTKKNK
jgi:hypothetical protein